MKLSFISIVLIISIIALSGCAQDKPLIVKQNFDDIDLTNHQNCKGVFLVEGAYDIGIGVFVAGDVAKGEIAIGDSTTLNGQSITVEAIEGNKKKWDKVEKPYRVALDFGRQIPYDDSLDAEIYAQGELICFN
tara:strand:- start:272 stop:670 length:399 start_codon:yes stop_codon:yes gene_type:complete